jgi:hypothetical protein
MGTAPGAIVLEQEVFDRIGEQKIRKDGVLCESFAATEGRRGVAAMTGARRGAIGKLYCEGLGGLGL